MKKEKLKTIGYVAIHTLLLQAIVILVFAFVCVLAHVGLNKYQSTVLTFTGIASFLAMMFTFLCVSVFKKSYGVSLFAKEKGTFDGSRYKTDPKTVYEVSYGNRSMITGERKVEGREKQVSSGGGAIILLGFPAVIVGFTGIFKFIIEALRVYRSDARQKAWDDSRDYLIRKMNEEGIKKFFKLPIICGTVLLISAVISFPTMWFNHARYNPSNLHFTITEKENINNQFSQPSEIDFNGTLENTRGAAIRHIEGKVYFKDRNGNILNQFDTTLRINSDDDYLQKNEVINVSFSVFFDKNDPNVIALWNASLDDVEITMEVEEIRYKWDKFIEFSNQLIVIKPLGE